MKIDSIQNGYVIDHITVGNGMKIVKLLGLNDMDCSVAIIKNVKSSRMGRKDIVKIDQEIDIDFSVMGFLDPGVTISIIRNEKCIKKLTLSLPEKVVNIMKCNHLRCVTQIEPEIYHVFLLSNAKKQQYRCLYCETVWE